MKQFAILPHPKAPIFSEEYSQEETEKVLLELIQEMQSPNVNMNAEARELIRQLGFVSLWFFLKFILGVTGPYDFLNDDLHLDMANWRQSSYCMGNGAKSAGFIPRGHCKTTIWGHGADSWEILRNPNIKIALVNAIVGKAVEFKRTVMRNFDSNPAMEYFYPEYFVRNPRSQDRWNEEDMVIPARKRTYTEPTLKALGATGAAEGGHYDLEDLDDLVGLGDLTSLENASAAGMERKNRWFSTNSRTLLTSWRLSRINLKATLYAEDDTYAPILKNIATLAGYTEEPDVQPTLGGNWNVYYRQIKEDGEFIYPENYNQEELDRLIEDDPWTAWAQYFNKIGAAGGSEFKAFTIHRARKYFDEKAGKYMIVVKGDPNFDETDYTYSLDECDVVGATDPAGTETGITARTSRTAHTVWALTPDGRWKVNIWGVAGYFNMLETFSKIFFAAEMFDGYLRKWVIESNAMQKILGDLLVEERNRREIYLPIDPIPAKGDKVARIRSVVGLGLQHGDIAVVDEVFELFAEEKQVFPQSKRKMDYLDACEKAISALITPLSKEQEDFAREQEMAFMMRGHGVTGY